jgi:Rap1a immunity proteins
MFLRAMSIALCLLTIGIVSRSRAAEGDIGNLLNECSDDQQAFGFTYCVAFVTAALDFMRVNGFMMRNLRDDKDGWLSAWGVCFEGQNTTVRAAIQVFMNWAQAHPERWSEPDYIGVAEAFRDHWQCRVPKPTPGFSLPVPKLPPLAQ